MRPQSIYTPEGAFEYLVLALLVALLAAVAYLLAFTGAGL